MNELNQAPANGCNIKPTQVLNRRKQIPLLLMFISFSILLNGCRREIDPIIAYCSRAVVAVQNNLGSSVQGFVVNYAEYFEENGEKRVILDCTFNHGSINDLKKHYFTIGEGEEFQTALNKNRAIADKETGLILIDYGEKEYLKYEELEVNTRTLMQNVNEYRKTRNPDFLGM